MVKRKRGFDDPGLVTYKIFLLVLSGIMIFGFVVYLIQYLNLSVQHTVLLPPGLPGALMSMRYTFRYWLIFLAATQALLLFAALATSLFSGKNGFCSGFWFVVLVLLMVAFIVFFVFLAREATNCNGLDEDHNICNHPLRCCDPTVNNNPASGCPGPTTCNNVVPEFPSITPPITIDKLGWGSDFVWLFWTTLIFVVLDVVILIVIGCVTMWEPSMRPDDPLESTFTTTGSFATTETLPLTSNIGTTISGRKKDSGSIAGRVTVRRRATNSSEE